MYCGQYPLRGPLEGVGPEIETFWALKWQRTQKNYLLYIYEVWARVLAKEVVEKHTILLFTVSYQGRQILT
jgi:hypothetical protein